MARLPVIPSDICITYPIMLHRLTRIPTITPNLIASLKKRRICWSGGVDVTSLIIAIIKNTIAIGMEISEIARNKAYAVPYTPPPAAVGDVVKSVMAIPTIVSHKE